MSWIAFSAIKLRCEKNSSLTYIGDNSVFHCQIINRFWIVSALKMFRRKLSVFVNENVDTLIVALFITPNKAVCHQKSTRGIKEEYLVIIMGWFSPVLHKNICCGYSLETPHRGTSNEYPQHMFLWRNKKNYPRIITKYSSLTIPLKYQYFFVPPTYGEGDMLILVRILLELASMSRFLVCTISCEPVVGFLWNFHWYIIGT